MNKSFCKGVLMVVALLGVPACVEEADDSVGAEQSGDTDPAGLAADERLRSDDGLVLEDEAGLDDGLVQARALGMEVTAIGDAAATSDPVVIAAAGDCAAGTLCLWQHVNHTGRRLQFSGAGCQNLGPYGFNDTASSWYNRNGSGYRIYWDANCRGSKFTARSGARSSSMGGWNDKVSSICRGAGCP